MYNNQANDEEDIARMRCISQGQLGIYNNQTDKDEGYWRMRDIVRMRNKIRDDGDT